MDNTNKKVVFLHLPKTGGSSLHNLLTEKYDSEIFFPDRHDTLEQYSRNELSKYYIFSGHFFLE